MPALGNTPPVPTGPLTPDDRVSLEVARWIWRNAPLSAATGALAAVIFYVDFREHVPAYFLWTLLSAFACFSLVHLGLWRSPPKAEREDIRRFISVQVLLCLGASGWSGVGTLVLAASDHPGGLVHIALLASAVGVCNALILLGVPWAARLGLVLGLTPIILLLLDGTRAESVAGFALLVFLFMFDRLSNVLAKVLRRSISLSVQNETLAQQLTVERDNAEQVNRAKTRFFAAASHDLRQPLYAVSLLVHSLQASPPGQPQKVAMRHISRNLRAMEQLLETLLDISRLDSGRQPPQNAHFALQDIFDALQARFEQKCIGKDIYLAIKPSADVLLGDPMLLESALSNLIDNAIKATTTGGIWVGYRAARGTIEVRDSGVGIPPEKVGLIFEDFYQVDNPARQRSAGLGLGLAIVRRVAQRSGQQCFVRSRPGRGSTFSLTVTPGNPAAVKRQTEAETHEPLAMQVRALLIEDDEEVSHAFSLTMRGWGAECRTATSLKQAQQIIADGFRPNLLLSDYWLAEGPDGVRALVALRAQAGEHLPAVLITGDSDIRPRIECEACNIQLLRKPLRPARLRTLLHRIALAEVSEPQASRSPAAPETSGQLEAVS